MEWEDSERGSRAKELQEEEHCLCGQPEPTLLVPLGPESSSVLQHCTSPACFCTSYLRTLMENAGKHGRKDTPIAAFNNDWYR